MRALPNRLSGVFFAKTFFTLITVLDTFVNFIVIY